MFCLIVFGRGWGWGDAGSFGALVHGPTGHFFYGALDAKLPGTKPMTVATKVAIDQVRFEQCSPPGAINSYTGTVRDSCSYRIFRGAA